MQTPRGGTGARSRGGLGTSLRHLSTGPALSRMVGAICSQEINCRDRRQRAAVPPPAAAAAATATRASAAAHVGDCFKRARQSFCTLRVHKAHGTGRRRLAAGLVVADRHLCPPPCRNSRHPGQDAPRSRAAGHGARALLPTAAARRRPSCKTSPFMQWRACRKA